MLVKMEMPKEAKMVVTMIFTLLPANSGLTQNTQSLKVRFSLVISAFSDTDRTGDINTFKVTTNHRALPVITLNEMMVKLMVTIIALMLKPKTELLFL